MMLVLFSGLLLAVTIAVTNSQTSTNRNDEHSSINVKDVKSANNIVDFILEQLRGNAIDNGLDPMSLPDNKRDFSIKFLSITYHGELYFTEGWLQNLSLLERSGDSDLHFNGSTLEIKTTVKFDKLFMTYRYLAKVMNIGPKGDVIGYIDDAHLGVSLLVDLKTCDTTLKSLHISDAGRLDVLVDGHWLLDLIINVVIDFFTWLLRSVILQYVEDEMRQTVSQILLGFDLADLHDTLCHSHESYPNVKTNMR